MIIAIDGHSSCGKSTLAKELARRLDICYIDSGAMYRAVTYYVLQNNIDYKSTDSLDNWLSEINIEIDKDQVSLNGRDISKEIRTQEVSQLVSEISTLSLVRIKLVELQRSIAGQKSIIMDGRDIGTVVFPHADLKLFVTADVDVRTERRYQELLHRGFDVTRDEVRANLTKRDRIDSTRDDSPLMQADDAILLDNSLLSREEQLQVALDLVHAISQ